MGIECAADLYRQPTPGPHPAIFIGHGFNQTKEALIPHAYYLHKADFNMMAID